jgi:hypothetical protein
MNFDGIPIINPKKQELEEEFGCIRPINFFTTENKTVDLGDMTLTFHVNVSELEEK